MASVLRFVDSVSSTPTVRLNLNDWSIWRLLVEGTEFPPPPLRRAVAQTLLSDGGTIPSAAYDMRVIRLNLYVRGTADNVATQVQNLMRELDRPNNVLQWQQETTQPVFFRTFRTSADSVVDHGPIDGTGKRLEVELLAEPFAYGLREDPVVAQTVNFNPAAGSNGGFFDIAAASIKGDVETPVKMTFPAALTGQSLLSVRRRGTPSGTPFLLQAESMTPSTDTSTQANDAAFSGSGNNWTRTTFATVATLAGRLSITTFPASPSVDVRGTYRVFGRMRHTVSGDTIKVRVQIAPAQIPTSEGTVTLPAGTGIAMVDLGLCSIPASPDPVIDMVTGTEIAAVGTEVQLLASRTGSGNLDVDFLLFVPADDRLAFLDWGSFTPATDWVLDGFNEVVYGRDASGRVETTGSTATYIGGAPMLTPNRDHRIFWIYDVEPASPTTIGTTTSISLSYWPRYLAIRPAST
jgi:hypothetical protein